ARRVFDLLDQPAERATGIVSTPAREAGPALAIERLTFAFPEADLPVVKDVSFTVPRGQTVALVGPSGSGKSTLLKLILGHYPTPPGSIHLLGHDLNDWQLSAARDQLALVAQDTYLFPVSLGENIRLGRPEATPAEVERAARLANIHDFIAGLPDGYATLAGERGARLSGGQRQRIALARAILKDAPILLLDEPTSALDTESESLVQQALETYSRGRTTLVIAHRLSTIKNADHVVVLEDGSVVEQGTHDALLVRGGLYLELYRRQFNGASGEASHE
ncbi:MAG TPA: ATP-binding cassette domain-containing protein, partial [Anaerolineales bacterium]|nr:ATP-binding cassette domain-containing protein [Anaerolineales bacterium]